MKTSDNIDGPCIIMTGKNRAILCNKIQTMLYSTLQLSPLVVLACVAIHDNRICNYRSINPGLLQFDEHTLIRSLGQEHNALFADTTLCINSDSRRAHNLYMRDRLSAWILGNDDGAFVPIDLNTYHASDYFQGLDIPPVLAQPAVAPGKTPPSPEEGGGQNEMFDAMMAELDAALAEFHVLLKQD